MQEFFIGWDIAHGRAIMNESDNSFHIHNAHEGQAAQFDQIHFLAIQPSHTMVGIRHAHKRNSFIVPEPPERFGIVGTHGKDLSPA